MFNKRWLLVFVAFALLILLVPACGDDDEESSLTTTPISTTTAASAVTSTSTATPTAQPSSTQPVKIGAINSWSGPAAISGTSLCDPIIKLVEKQVKDQGGILGGRELKVAKYDNRASVADAVAGASKLMIDEKVSVLTIGGISGAEMEAVAQFAEENEILFIGLGAIENATEKSFQLSGTVGYKELVGSSVNLMEKLLKPATVAFMAADLADSRERVRLYKEDLEALGVDSVYEDYVSMGTSDLSSYLTKIKYQNPDVLIIDCGSNELVITVAIQIMEQGGWGDIKVITLAPGESAKTRPGAQGWYVNAMWVPGLESPGALKFQTEYEEMHGKTPSATQVYYYNTLWTAVYAIEAAGTDTDLVKIAETARFSGKLEWDTPMGHGHWTAESLGYGQLSPTICQIIDKELVPVDIPD